MSASRILDSDNFTRQQHFDETTTTTTTSNNTTLSIHAEWLFTSRFWVRFSSWVLFAVKMAKGQHKPRRKVRNGDSGVQLTKSETLYRAPSFPLAAFLWPARGSVSPWEGLPLILMVIGLFRWAAGLWGYSGECDLVAISSRERVARLRLMS